MNDLKKLVIEMLEGENVHGDEESARIIQKLYQTQEGEVYTKAKANTSFEEPRSNESIQDTEEFFEESLSLAHNA